MNDINIIPIEEKVQKINNIGCVVTSCDLVHNDYKDYIALSKVEHACKNDGYLMAWIEARKITIDQSDPACLGP